ncbi:MAG TPA: winged helix-turn-helix domain-containing protein [Methanotrichaceae archaeon]|nr:winged helix-turn-helix domain-containing protein [Methanotrichaceae archaeon]
MRRDRLKIILDILDICNSGANKTKIVYQANLNFKMVNVYIDILMNEGLLHPQDASNGKIFLTTIRGKELLKNVRQIYDRLDRYSPDGDRKI